MKKIYLAPDVQCTLLSSADVITASPIQLKEIDLRTFTYMDSFAADR